MQSPKESVDEFLSMRLSAELRALSKINLQRHLTDAEFSRFKTLANMKLEGKI